MFVLVSTINLNDNNEHKGVCINSNPNNKKHKAFFKNAETIRLKSRTLVHLYLVEVTTRVRDINTVGDELART